MTATAQPPGRRRLRALGVLIAGGLVVAGLAALASPDRGDSAGAGAGSGSDPDDASVGAEGDTVSDRADRTLTLAFAGDVHFEGGLRPLLTQPGATLGPLSWALRGADLAMVNLESALGTGGRQAEKELEDPGNRFWFQSPGSALDLLARSGVDVVTLANNHGADYGRAGLLESLRIAQDAPVSVVGVGRDSQAAFAGRTISVKGTDVAVLAADASALESADPVWTARPGTGPGLASARVGHAPQLAAAVRAAAREADLVVVYLHWGDENTSCPSPEQRVLARTLSEAGADVLVGSHAHRQQGSGLLGDTYVSYGLGNFLWYHGRTAETGVLKLRVTGDQVVDEQWLPGEIPLDGGVPAPVGGAARAQALEDRQQLRACTDLAPAPTAPATGPDAGRDALPAYSAKQQPIDFALARRMRSHEPARCPTALRDLRHLTMSYVGFDGRAHRGEMVVHESVTKDVARVFGGLYRARFPIARMELIDTYAGDDNRSMAANNTSAYNCRRVAGQATWSDHAYGKAIDINPVQNPYVLGSQALPPAGARFVGVDRSAGAGGAPGVIRDGDVVRRSFERIGWSWGGDFAEPDFQHFSRP